MAADFVGGETEVVGTEFVDRPFETLEDHVAGDELGFCRVLVPKCVDGCGRL